ncbi:RadC-like JAB domain-containing protein [Halpernia humi]|uniref:RadC-like JAB domain-containing protein n=1 Tax=Halpernia humi TaxID=493375 RepID=A0A1H5X6I7_9FLAO|nr:JAB domain-containing protein [Halpernia humi]SEG07065.1 RadC-like JAB domain-containing protein [Halpernia humi]
MRITLDVGKYNENKESPGFQKMDFESIDEAIANLEFMKMGFNYFKNGESLKVRLEEGSKVHLIDYDAVVPINELRQELYEKYSKNVGQDEQQIHTDNTAEKKKLSANSNFAFEEDETTHYAKTSSGEKLPFKLFNAGDTGSGSNLLREPQNSLQSTDFALIERRFAENKSLQLFGNEKITSVDDVAWLFKSLENEAVEHAFLVYDFKDKGYFVQHISTGTFDAAFVDNRLMIGNVLEVNPSSITLVHNHPSGNLKVSKADIDCIRKLRAALDDSDIIVNDGVIINLRSGKYVVFNEIFEDKMEMKSNPNALQEIQPYSFSKQVLVENYQPEKITSSADIAKFITSQKFGISDKTEMLIINNQLNIVGKFIMPPENQVGFIIGKVAKFGGNKCILYGNNITPEEVNKYNEKLQFSNIEILDGLKFKSENGRKMYDSFADSGLINSVSNKLGTTNEAEVKYTSKPEEIKLSWLDKIKIQKSEAYKSFVKEMKETSPEFYFQDGERIFTAQEKKFQLYYNQNQNKILSEDQFRLSELSSDDSLTKSFSIKTIPEVLKNLRNISFSENQTYTLIEGKGMKKFFISSPEDLQSAIDVLSNRQSATHITINNNNLKSEIMENKEFDQVDYLQNQLKYLGFGEGEKLHKDLKAGIDSVENQFELKTSSDKASLGNEVDFTLKFNKTESGGVFLNSYKAVLNNDKGEEISQNFKVNRENTFTAKEAVNLLEGRSVKIEFTNPKTEQLEPAFVKLNFAEPKSENGNYNFQNFYKNYGVDTDQIVEKSNLIFDKPEYKESTIKSLEKGNVVKVKFELDDNVVEGKAVLNPQYKNLSIYDNEMNRINTNKPLEGLENDNKHDKGNVKEQSIKR